MFLSELSPVFRELIQQPIAFAGGFFSGVFKLNLNEQPLSDWLDKQGYVSENNSDDDRGNGPQSISID